MRCSFIKDTEDEIVSVDFLARNVTQFEDIVKFQVIGSKPAFLTSFGVYLFGNITLNNIAETSKEASITFNNLSCIHEREYICRLYVFPKGIAGQTTSLSSEPMRISVKGKLLSCYVFINLTVNQHSL